MKHILFSVARSVRSYGAVLAATFAFSLFAAGEKVDNSTLIPPFVEDAKVSMEGMSPDWVKTLIMAQFRIETATPEGTFASATKVLDHYAEMGVNGLWINPVYQRDPNSATIGFNGFGNYGPHTIEPALTGTEDINESFKVTKNFVEEAHKRNIRVLFDIVTWGVASGSPLIAAHEDWFSVNGVKKEMWGGRGFNWDVPELREWFISAAVEFIIRTSADGFRCDLEPHITGYDLFGEIRKRLYDKGRKVIIITEFVNDRRGVYDFEQVSIAWEKEIALDRAPDFFESGDYYLEKNIVESTQTGKGIGAPNLQLAGMGGMFRFYTFNLASHDSKRTFVRGSRLRMGYQAILAPVIPMWNIGEEWNNPEEKDRYGGEGDVLYYNAINWDKLDEPSNRSFFEDVKKFIGIRRSYRGIFESFPENHRAANIVKVDVPGNTLQAYARYGDGKAIIIVPNQSTLEKIYKINVSLDAIGMAGKQEWKITDLISNKSVSNAAPANRVSFEATTPADGISIYMVE